MIIKQKCEGFISLAVGKTYDNPRYKTEFKNLIVDQGLNNAANEIKSSGGFDWKATCTNVTNYTVKVVLSLVFRV